MAGRQLQITYTANDAAVLASQKRIDAGHTKMQGGVNKTSGAFKSAFGSVIPIGAAAAGVAVVALAGTVINAASDQGEAINKAKVIFGEASESVLKFSDDSATSFGIAKAEALSAASGFGAMFDSAGLVETKAADMSIVMTELAGDMASFNNEDPSDMLERLRSGLAGEAEPLRRFGVFISAARVETEAYASGIAEAGKELTEAQKIQARYNLILQDTTKQQGDFGRTVGESLPNQMRVMKAELIDVAAEVGTALLPALLDLVQALRDILPLLKPIAEGLAEVVSIAAEALSTLIDVLTLDFEGLESGFTDHMAAVEDLIAQYGRGKIGAAELEDGLRSLAEETGVLTQWSQELVVAAHAERDALMRGKQAAFEYAQAQENATDETRDGAAANRDAARASREAAEATREQRLAILALSNEFLAIVDSGNAVADAQRELNRLGRQGKQDTKDYEQAVLDAITAQFGLEESVLSYGQSLVDAGRKQRDVERAVRDAASEFRIQETAVSDIIDEIREYIRQLNGIPSHVSTTITTTHVSEREGHGGIRAAEGFHGVVSGPTHILAGEAGPERVDITPTGELAMVGARGGHGAGGVTVIVNVAGSVHDKQDLARTIRDEFVRLQRRNVTTGIV